MTEDELSLYGLMKTAADQQGAVDKAILALKAEQKALAQVRVEMQAATAQQLEQLKAVAGGVSNVASHIKQAAEQAIPAIKNAASGAVEVAATKSMQEVADSAVGALSKAAAPFIQRLEGATSGADSASQQIKKASLWFAWHWVALAAGGVAGLLVVTWAIFQILVSWDSDKLIALRAKQAQIQQQIAQDQITADALAKRVHGIRFATSKEGDFILVPRGFESMRCIGNVQCVKLK
jgi:hypothetical protein